MSFGGRQPRRSASPATSPTGEFSPAIDAGASFNRAEDQLFDSDEAALVSQLRASVTGEDALETMSKLLVKIGETASSAEMLGAIK